MSETTYLQDYIARHTPSAEVAATIRSQRAAKLARKRRYWLSLIADGGSGQAPIHMGSCAGGDGEINYGDFLVRRGRELYHAGCDPEGRNGNG